MRILFMASNFPDPVNKTWAPWNKNAVDSVLDFAEPVVIAPRPFSPPLSKFSTIPYLYEEFGYPVYYPRFIYLLPKSLFYCLTGNSYRYFVGRYVLRGIKHGEISKPDIIHALHPYLDGYGAVPLAEKLGVPLLITVHSPGNLKKCPKKVLSALNKADKVITIAEFLRRDLIRLGLPEDKVEHVSLGVDPNEFRPLRWEDSRIVVKKYGLKPDEIVVLYVGQLVASKNVEMLLYAAHVVLKTVSSESSTHIRFVIVGDGPTRRYLHELVLKLGIDEHIIFTGAIPHDSQELREWYGLADIFVLPSLSEGKPVAVYEAMSSGCAIIASNVGGIPEQVLDGVNGFIISPKDAITLSERILYLITNRRELEQMKNESRKLLFKFGYTVNDYRNRIRSLLAVLTQNAL